MLFIGPDNTNRVMIKRGKKDEISLRAKQIIWDTCETEIRMAEKLVGKNMPELWQTFPSTHNKSEN